MSMHSNGTDVLLHRSAPPLTWRPAGDPGDVLGAGYVEHNELKTLRSVVAILGHVVDNIPAVVIA
jgi:hypothetical protein